MKKDRPAAIFDRALASWSIRPRYDRHRYSDSPVVAKKFAKLAVLVRQQIEYVRERSRLRGGMPKVHSYFIDDLDVNAFAFSDGSRLFMGLNAGTLMRFEPLFAEILRHPKTMLRIGNPYMETEDPLPDRDVLARMPRANIRDALQGTGSRAPICPQRKVLVTYLSLVVAEIIVLHELAHLRNGHVFLAEAKSGFCCLNENDYVADAAGVPLGRHALEHDADVFAISHSIVALHTRWSAAVADQSGSILGTIIKDLSMSCYLWHFAADIFFSFFGQMYPDHASTPHSTHPHMGQRYWAALCAAYSVLPQVEPNLCEMLVREQRNAAEDTAEALRLLNYPQTVNRVASAIGVPNLESNLTAYLAEFQAAWKLLRPKLQPLAYAPLPTYSM